MKPPVVAGLLVLLIVTDIVSQAPAEDNSWVLQERMLPVPVAAIDALVGFLSGKEE